jgi:hypothetical protein
MPSRNRETSYYSVRKYRRQTDDTAKELELVGFYQGEDRAATRAERLQERLTQAERDAGIFYEQAWARRDEALGWIAAHSTPRAPKKYQGRMAKGRHKRRS